MKSVAIAALFLFLFAPTSRVAAQTTTGQNTPAKRTPSLDGKADTVRAHVVYSKKYLIDLGGIEKMHPFDIRKYEKIYKKLIDEKLLDEKQTHIPKPLSLEEIKLIHTDDYLANLKKPAKIAEYLEADILKAIPASLIVKPFQHASGGTLLASRLALKDGIAINIGGGYHHAKPDTGEGFCIFADVPIAIKKLQAENKIKRAVIIDVDVHQGNGTICCLKNDESTYVFSMHQKNIYPIPKEKGDLDVELRPRIGDDEYLKILDQHLEKALDKANADICFVVGGCDTLKNDPLADLRMTHDGIVKRDAKIIAACVKRKIPVVLTLSGGYSKNAWQAQYKSIANLIKTYKIAESKTPRRD